MPGTHFAVVLSEAEINAIADAAIADSAARLVRAALRSLADPCDPPEAAAEAEALARLHALARLRGALDRQADRAAAGAALAGAGYPQLGRACDISRQGARRRWPGLVAPRTPSHSRTADRSR
jgi:hypothetical protein